MTTDATVGSLTGGQALAKSLVREGVTTIFGLPGDQIMHALDGLYGERDKLRFITTRHEQGTTYMADGYARAGGRPGVALVVPGVGVYNAAAGLATAWATSSPVLLIAAGLWYTFMPRALAYSLVNALLGGIGVIIFACNVLLLQWVEGHAMDHVHTRYNGADGVLEAAFVLQSFQLALTFSNILAGLYVDLEWRPTPGEMARTMRDRKELEQDVDANSRVLGF